MARDTVLLTGGCGFSGPHIAEHILHNTDWDVIILDRMSYAGSLERLRDTRRDFEQRIRFVFHDFRGQYTTSVLRAIGKCDYIIHNGAETHVDRALQDAEPFVMSNVLGTMHTLEAARSLGVSHFIQVSTDEVHGAAPDGVSFREDAPIRPSNPYSASKAGAEALAFSYWKSHGVPVTITRTMNLFGERQHPEKFVPMTIRKLMTAIPLVIHADESGRSGERKWLHCRNQASALLFILNSLSGEGETFHIAGEEHTNLQVAEIIADELRTDMAYELRLSDRPGHDFRYSLDDRKLRGLGWFPPVPFEESLRRTVAWSVRPENRYWLEESHTPVTPSWSAAHIAAGG